MRDDNEGLSGMTAMGALLAGACIGGGIALLTAPQNGAKLRGQIRDYAGRAGEGAAKTWDQAIERGIEYTERGQQALQEAERLMCSMIDRGNDYIETGKSKAKGMMYSRSSNNSNTVLSAGALLAGALVGGGLALLVTPKSGTKFRKQLKNYADRAMDEMAAIGRR